MSSAWAKGSTRAWRRIRALVLARDGHRCRLQLPDVCTGRATHAHHTVGKAVTGDDPTFLVAACAACNGRTGDPRGKPDPPPRPRTRW